MLIRNTDKRELQVSFFLGGGGGGGGKLKYVVVLITRSLEQRTKAAVDQKRSVASNRLQEV